MPDFLFRSQCRRSFGDGRAEETGGDAGDDAQGDVEEAEQPVSLSEEFEVVVAEGGEGGEASAETGCQEEADFGRKIQFGGEGIEESDQKTAEDVDGESGPGEIIERDALMHQHLHSVSHYATESPSYEYRYIVHIVLVIVIVLVCKTTKNRAHTQEINNF